MTTKKELLCRIILLEDSIDTLTEDIIKLEKRVKKLEPKKEKKAKK